MQQIAHESTVKAWSRTQTKGLELCNKPENVYKLQFINSFHDLYSTSLRKLLRDSSGSRTVKETVLRRLQNVSDRKCPKDVAQRKKEAIIINLQSNHIKVQLCMIVVWETRTESTSTLLSVGSEYRTHAEKDN